MTAREDGGHVKLPLAFVAPASEIPLEEGVDYSAIIAALLRVSSMLDVFFFMVFRLTHMALEVLICTLDSLSLSSLSLNEGIFAPLWKFMFSVNANVS